MDISNGVTLYNVRSDYYANEVISEAANNGWRVQISGHDSASYLMVPILQVGRLVHSGGNGWPPMKTVRLIRRGILGKEEELYGVIDGLHRWEAAKKLELTYVSSEVGTYKNDEHIIAEVLMANLAHGIPANNVTRKALAVRLIDIGGMDIEEIADYVGLSKGTIKILMRKLAGEETEKGNTESSANTVYIQRFIGYFRKFFKDRVDAPREYDEFDRNYDNELLEGELYQYILRLPEHTQEEVVGICQNIDAIIGGIVEANNE